MAIQPIALAQSLVRPVAAGMMLRDQAGAAVLNHALRLERSDELEGDGGPLRHCKVAMLLLDELVERQILHIDVTAHRIKRRIRPMLDRRAKSNFLLAHAHEVNGDAGFPLSEEAVTAIVTEEVMWRVRKGDRAIG